MRFITVNIVSASLCRSTSRFVRSITGLGSFPSNTSLSLIGRIWVYLRTKICRTQLVQLDAEYNRKCLWITFRTIRPNKMDSKGLSAKYHPLLGLTDIFVTRTLLASLIALNRSKKGSGRISDFSNPHCSSMFAGLCWQNTTCRGRMNRDTSESWLNVPLCLSLSSSAQYGFS